MKASVGAVLLLAASSAYGLPAWDITFGSASEIAIFNNGASDLFTQFGSASINVNGDVVAMAPFTPPAGMTVTGDIYTADPEFSTTFSLFNDLVMELDNAIASGSPIVSTLTSGVENNFTPGIYTFADSVNLGAGTVINLVGEGDYIFEFALNMLFSDVVINGPGGSSDNVVWYENGSGQVSITNTQFFGTVVAVGDGPHQLVTAGTGIYDFNGRFLTDSELTTNFWATGTSTFNMNSPEPVISVVPEPSSFFLLAIGLPVLAGIARRRGSVL